MANIILESLVSREGSLTLGSVVATMRSETDYAGMGQTTSNGHSMQHPSDPYHPAQANTGQVGSTNTVDPGDIKPTVKSRWLRVMPAGAHQAPFQAGVSALLGFLSYQLWSLFPSKRLALQPCVSGRGQMVVARRPKLLGMGMQTRM